MSSSTITTKDGTEIYYKDWGKGPVVTFSHGWPLSSDAWDGQMLFLAQNGFRVVAHDRRGHVPPDAQRMFAQRMNATTISLNSSHASPVSHPDEIAQLILDAARGSTG